MWGRPRACPTQQRNQVAGHGLISYILSPMPDDPSPAPVQTETPALETLQFQRAEYAGPSCAFCKSKIYDLYYHVSDAVACPTCAEGRKAAQGRPDGRGAFPRAALYGVGAAIGGSIIYWLVGLTGWQFGIVAILVGIMVGKSIRHATKGKTTRAYQVLAVLLTYGSITTSYVPQLVSYALSQQTKSAAESGRPAAKPPAVAPGAQSTPSLGKALVLLALGLAILAGVAAISPFLYVLESPVSGAINLLIIGIGLQQAWRLTRPDEALIMGPYRVSELK